MDQIRRPSGRPQGILNIGVTLLDSSKRSMPLYAQIATSAVGYHGLAGEDDSYLQKITENNNAKGNRGANASNVKPILRRSRSERSVAFDKNSMNGSVVGVPQKMKAALEKDNSIISISNEPFKGIPHKGKASSVINGTELRDKRPNGGRRRGGKAGSILSEAGGVSKMEAKPIYTNVGDPKTKGPNEKNGDEKFVPVPKTVPPSQMAIGKPIGGPRGNGKFVSYKAGSIVSDSEVGPSPSEVAAVMAQRRYPLEEEPSVLNGWSVDESVEGLKSKLERWRTELPPLYDADYASSSFRSRSTSTNHKRRHTEGSSGLFSCFGNICGYECQCICGKPPERKNTNSPYRSPSFGGSYF